jgi:hypothetical protein
MYQKSKSFVMNITLYKVNLKEECLDNWACIRKYFLKECQRNEGRGARQENLLLQTEWNKWLF